jgi:soluble lytic murein transglycosylase
VNAGRAWVVALIACACRPEDAQQARPPASAVAGTPDAGRQSIDEGMPRLERVLDDVRLAAARDDVDSGDDSAAAREVDRVRTGTILDGSHACAWDYLAGRLHLAADESSEAASAFARAQAQVADAERPCPLADYARLRQAQSLVHVGRFSEALAVARTVGDPLSAQDETALVIADALSGTGERAAAVSAWRSLLAAQPHGLRWVDTSLQLTRALLDGVDGPAASRAKEALERVTRVIVEAPAVAEKLGASELRSQAAIAGGATAPLALTVDERLRQAQAWLDDSQPSRAREVATSLLQSIPAGEKIRRPQACKAATTVAQAVGHRKSSEAADAWGVAIARCEGDDDALVNALYVGGKASASANRADEALARFAGVEARFPEHRLADDARLRGGRIVLEQGDVKRGLAMLSSLPDAYPAGDVRGEALFRAAIVQLGSDDLDEARAALDRAMTLAADPPGSPMAGRAQYFRARISELQGDVADAKSRYASLIQALPLSYYMLLAYGRLQRLDAVLARSTAEAGMRAEPIGRFLTQDHAVLVSLPFQRFVRLLEVGELDAARREASAAGIVSEDADSEVLWTVAWLYDRAGAPELGHAFARSRQAQYRTHWPAGRWRLPWEVAFPRAWPEVVVRESSAAQIPPPLAWAIMREESAFNPEARSAAGALGLMQLMPATAKKVAGDASVPYDELALKRPEVSIELGTRLLASLRQSFSGRPEQAIASYNAGTVAVRRWLSERSDDAPDMFVEHIKFDETRAYVKRVLESQAAYAYLYDPAPLDELPEPRR